MAMTENQLKYLQYQENQRHNLASEGIDTDKNAETARSNRAREAETYRANTTQEAEIHRSNLARETETNRSNVAKELETHRSNVESERIRDDANAVALTVGAAKAAADLLDFF